MHLYTVSLMIGYGYCKALGSLNSYCRMQRQLLPLQEIDFPSFRTTLNYTLQTLCLQKNSRSCFFLGMCEICFLVIVIFNAAMYQNAVFIIHYSLYTSLHIKITNPLILQPGLLKRKSSSVEWIQSKTQMNVFKMIKLLF